MKTSGIYKIVNKVNGKYYVGSSKDITGNVRESGGRWYYHKYNLNNIRHKNDHLQNAWNKYGENNFDFIVVEIVESIHSKLLEVEQKYLDIAKTEKDKCYNMVFTAGRVDATPEIREKMSIAKLGKYLGEKNPFFKIVPNKIKDELKNVWILGGVHKLELYAKEKYNFGNGVCNRIILEFKTDDIAVKLRGDRYRLSISECLLINGLKGKFHPMADKTSYIFKNKNTGELFSGLKIEFKEKYNFKRGCMWALKRKNFYKGWEIIGRS